MRAGFERAGIDAYVHAPYMINVASPNNRIRIPSRKLLEQQLAAAASIGAKGLIVHGGHVTAGTDPEEGYDSWRKAVERIDRPLPMLIENTAGGDGAMARGLDAIARLWDAIGDAADGGGEVGFCLDTCHAFASGEELATVVDRIKAITGRIDLVHCNNSRDEFGSGRDRHAGMESGQIDPALARRGRQVGRRDRNLRDAGRGRRRALAAGQAQLARRLHRCRPDRPRAAGSGRLTPAAAGVPGR